MTSISRLLFSIVTLVFLGLGILAMESLTRPVQAFGHWMAATGLLFGGGAMVLWPRQLLARNAGTVGTRRPGVARGFGVFGLVMALFFQAMASVWAGRFQWLVFVVGLAASTLCAFVGLRHLRRGLNAPRLRNESEAVRARSRVDSD